MPSEPKLDHNVQIIIIQKNANGISVQSYGHHQCINKI